MREGTDAAQGIFDGIQTGLNTAPNGSAFLRSWFQIVLQDCALRDEDFDGLVTVPLQDDLVEAVTQVASVLGPAIDAAPVALWLGLFEKAMEPDGSYVLTTYVSQSDIGSIRDEEWFCSASLVDRSYCELDLVTRAHKRPDGLSGDTTNALYVMLPLAFLAGVVIELASAPGLEHVSEFAFGWDSGDVISWCPQRSS